MIKLNRQVEALEAVIEKIEAKQEELQDKIDAYIWRAIDADRELTEAEFKKMDQLQEQIEELEEEADIIQNALDYLRDYTD